MAVQTSGLGLGQLLLALDRTMVSLVEAPRGLDMPVGSVALVDADDVRLGLAVGPGSADLFFLLGVSDAEAVRWIAAAARGRARGHLRQGTVARRRQAGSRARHRGGGRRTAGPLGAALPTGQPRLRTPRRPRRPAVRLRHRPVRTRAVHRRPHPRHDQHRGRGVPRAGVLGVQRRGRRIAPADDPGARRPARTSGVDRPVGHFRCVARQRRRGPGRRAPGIGATTTPRRRHPSAARPTGGAARFRRNDLAAAGVGGRWPTTSRRSCAAARCWRPASCRGWRPRRRRTPCGCRNCSACTRRAQRRRRDADTRYPRSPASSASPPTAAPR